MIRFLAATTMAATLLAAAGSAQIPEQPGADKIAKLIERLGIEMDDTAAKVLEAGTPASESSLRKTALETARSRADDAIGTIDEILDAIPPRGSGSSSSSDSGRPGNNSSGSKPRPKPSQPKDNKPDPSSPSANQPAPPQLPQAREHADHDLSAGRWGDLPVQVRELFRNPDTDRLPPRYRRWIEDYYRRVRQPDSR